MQKEDIIDLCRGFFGRWNGKIMSVGTSDIELKFLPDFRMNPMDAAITCSIKFERKINEIIDEKAWLAAQCPQNWPTRTKTITATLELTTLPPTIITLDSIRLLRGGLQTYFDVQKINMYYSREQQSEQSQQQISSTTISNTNLFKKSVAACVEPIATRQLITNIIQKMSTSDITYQNSTDGPMESGRLSDLCSNFEKYTWIRETLMGDIESDLKFFFP